MGILVGFSFFKSVDIFIIGLSFVMGFIVVVFYVILFKLIDLFGILLCSFIMIVYFWMAKWYYEEDMVGVCKIFYGYIGVVILFFILVVVFCFILVEFLIFFLGGSNYVDSFLQVILIFWIFMFYMLLLFIDCFFGVVLDSINCFKVNLYKVVVMMIVNVVIDFVGVFVF